MPTKSTITSISPLPSTVTREAAVAQLHDHTSMIEMNPLVIHHELTSPPEDAPPDEALMGTWYDITDRINYFPGFKGEVTYKACFYDLPNGLQTHTYAPAGLDLKGKFSICGNAPGEPREPAELGINVPRDCLYLKEEIEMQCSMLLSSFVKKNIRKSHRVMAQKLIARAEKASADEALTRFPTSSTLSRTPTSPSSSTHRPSLSMSMSNSTSPRKGSQSVKRSNTSSKRMSSGRPNCECFGMVHVRNCPKLRPENMKPANTIPENAMSSASTISDRSRSSMSRHSSNPPRIPSRASMQELPGSLKAGQCLCTGAVHNETCPGYPNLRRPETWAARSRSGTQSQEDALQPRPAGIPV